MKTFSFIGVSILFVVTGVEAVIHRPMSLLP